MSRETAEQAEKESGRTTSGTGEVGEAEPGRAREQAPAGWHLVLGHKFRQQHGLKKTTQTEHLLLLRLLCVEMLFIKFSPGREQTGKQPKLLGD